MDTNEHGFDLSAAEALFALPPIPITPESDLDGPYASRGEGVTLASYHSPECNCGRPHGITYDLNVILKAGRDPNETMLHELTHAWQYHRDPENAHATQRAEMRRYGYEDAPHEREARYVAETLNKQGVRVWFPERVDTPADVNPLDWTFAVNGR